MREYSCERGNTEAKVFVEEKQIKPTEIQMLVAKSIVGACEGRYDTERGEVDPKIGTCPSTCPLRKIMSGRL